MKIAKKTQMSLLSFITMIADGLVRSGKLTEPTSVGRPNKRKASDSPSPIVRKQQYFAVPCADV